VTYNVRNIAIAIVMAIAAAAVVLVYTTSYRQSVTRGQKRVDVMVASRDIVAGTPAEEASGAMVLTSVLADDKAPGALSTTAGLEGKVTGQAIYAGQQVVAATFGTSTTQAAQLQIGKAERAIRVNVDATNGMLGQVHAGDFVDVFATITVAAEGKNGETTTPPVPTAGHVETGATRIFTRRLLTKVRVLEVPAEDKKAPGGLQKSAKDDGATITLAVAQNDATKIAFAETTPDTTKVWFVVRPPEAVAQDLPLTIETLESMIADGESPAEIRKKYVEPLKLLYPGGS
jgi:Flp pilus assembly protein CpaB